MRMRARSTRRLTALGTSAFAPPSSQGTPGFSAFAAPLPSAQASAPSAPAAAIPTVNNATPAAQIVSYQPQVLPSQNAGLVSTVSEYGPQLADPGNYAYEAPPDDTASVADGWGLDSWLANLKPIGWLEIALAALAVVYVVKRI